MTEITERLSAALADRYTLERRLGEGGMATVHLAEDLKHKRKVAVKVLRPELAAVLGAERFVQEITTTASLQHPNILPLFDSGEADGFLYYVMPYIEGETLRERLNRETQLGIDEAVKITTDVAGALQAAHEQGVVHRDIKPENVLLHKGHAMVADFGIALAVSAAAGGRMTETGLSLGTPHYMSPEQATAEKDITARSDIYSLGSVLYEMLTSEPPHTGGLAQQVIMKIVTEPADPVTKMRKSVPPNVAAAVAKSLEKLPADRFESAKAFAEALTNPAFAVPTAATVAGIARVAAWRQRAALPFAAAAVAFGAAALWGWLRPAPPPPEVHRQRIVLGDWNDPRTNTFQMALAPDASAIAFVRGTPSAAVGGMEIGPVWVKERDEIDARQIAGTERALTVSFSPNGDWILYGTDVDLRRVPRVGGPSVLVSDMGGFAGGAWLRDETVVFTDRAFQHIYRVPVQGGEPELLIAAPDVGMANLGLVRPVPGAQAVLVVGTRGDPGSSAGVGVSVVLDLESKEVRAVIDGATNAWMLSRDYIVYGREDGGVFVAPFDLGSLELAGPAVPLPDRVSQDFGIAALQVSLKGTALYRNGGPGVSFNSRVEPIWISRDGSVTELPGWEPFPLLINGGFSVSPSGERVAYNVTGDDGRQDIWIRSLVSSAPPVRLTFEGGTNRRPTWTPDNESVVFISDRDGGHEAVWIRRADGREPARLLLRRDRQIFEALVSPDGDWLVYRTDDESANGAGDILAVRLNGDLRVDQDSVEISVAVTEEQETSPALSPDGRWLAYTRGPDDGKLVFVVPFPNVDEGGPYQVSTTSAISPGWSRSGRELFYQVLDGLYAVEVVTESGFAQLSNRRLFNPGGVTVNPDSRLYQVGADDQRFLFLRLTTEGPQGETGALVLVENWLTEIEARLKGGGAVRR